MREKCYSPVQFRQAWIAPAWKGQDRLQAVNYRPIALTNHLSKIYESIYREEIIEHLKICGLIDDDQHGSQSGRSTLTQLLVQQEAVLKMLEGGENVEIVYLDFSKTYDRVDHRILLSKLISHWLTNRVQRVKVNKSLSSWERMISGIP